MKKLLIILGLILLPNIAWGAGLNLNQGGTGWTTSSAGELLVGTTSPLRYSRLSIGAEGTCLGVVGGTLAYTTCGTGSGGNPFNQWLDTTSSVEFANITSTGQILSQGILGTIGGFIYNYVFGLTEGVLNTLSILFSNTDEPEKTGIINYNPTNNSFILASINDSGDIRNDMIFNIYGSTNFVPQATSTNNVTWVSGNYTSDANVNASGTLGIAHNSLVVNADYDGTAGINQSFKVFGNELVRQGTVDGYGATNFESNYSQRNWTTNSATYSGTNDLVINNYTYSSIFRNNSVFNANNSFTVQDANFHIDSVITDTETNGTSTIDHYGLYLENVNSAGATITKGSIDTYGIYIKAITGHASGNTYAIRDDSQAGWYNSGNLNVSGNSIFGNTADNYQVISSTQISGGIPYQAAYYTDEDSILSLFFTTFNYGVMLASDIVGGVIASTSLTTLIPTYDEGTEKETLNITSLLGRDLEVKIFGDLSIFTGKGITLGGEYRTTWPTGSGGGESSFWATSSNSLIGYPNLAGAYNIVIGAAVTTTNDILQVIGGAYINEDLTVNGDTYLIGLSNTKLAVDGNGKIVATSTPAEIDPVWSAVSNTVPYLSLNNTFSFHNIFSSLFATNSSTTNATTTNFAISNLATPAGAFLAISPTGAVITTTTAPFARLASANTFTLHNIFPSLFTTSISSTNATTSNLYITGLANTVLAVDSIGKVIATSTASAPIETDPVWTAAINTLPFLANSNTFLAHNIFSSLFATNASTTNATTTNLYVSGQTRLASLSGILKATTGVISAATVGTDYLSSATFSNANTWSAHNIFSSLFATNASTTNATTTNLHVNGVLSLANPIAATSGGTGASSYTIGDILYADTANTLAKLISVSQGSYLRSTGVGAAPVWSTLKLPNTANTNRLAAYTAANTLGELAAGKTGQYLSGVTGSIPAWATLNQAAVAGLTTASSPTFSGLTITNNATFGGNTTTTGNVVIGADGAARPGCLAIQDVDAAGWTYCYTLNGTMTCSVNSCTGASTSTLIIGR